MNIGNTADNDITTTDLPAAIELLVDKGGYEREDLVPLPSWLHRGDDILVFELADLSVMGSGRYPLYWAMPWERSEPTPRHAPDTTVCGLGWRYLPTMRVTVETVDDHAAAVEIAKDFMRQHGLRVVSDV